jgi:uncharacterized membrane protein YqjE
VDRKLCAGSLTQRGSGPSVIEVVVRQEDPSEVVRLSATLREEAEDGSMAAGVAGIDDDEAMRALVQVCLRAANARDPMYYLNCLTSIRRISDTLADRIHTIFRPLHSKQRKEEASMDSGPRPAAGSARTAGPNGSERRGLIDLARIAVDDVVKLVQQEIRLAKIELREMLSANLMAVGLLAAAGLFVFLFLLMLLVALIEWIPNHTLAALITAAVFLVAAIVLALVGKSLLKIGPPPKTMTTLKEDAEWARTVLKRNGR